MKERFFVLVYGLPTWAEYSNWRFGCSTFLKINRRHPFHFGPTHLSDNNAYYFFKILANPGPCFIYFRLFKQTSLQYLQQINVKKCPSRIWCWDSNSLPLEHESLPITTRPGLPPTLNSFYYSDPSSAFFRLFTFLLYNRTFYNKWMWKIINLKSYPGIWTSDLPVTSLLP